MKNKPKLLFIVCGCLFTIIAIIVGIIFLSKRDNAEFDNSIPESDRDLLTLYKENIANESKISYEEGDRINIILRDANTEYEYDKNPYMENVKVHKVQEDSVSLWVPFDYLSFPTAMQGSPNITIEFADATDSNGGFKVNKELYKLLYSKYSIPPNEENK